jgi:hypothetical protein
MKHTSIFTYAADSLEAYEMLQKQMKRDWRIGQASLIAVGIFFALAIKSGAADGWPWLIGGLVSAFYGLLVFVEYSNRDYFLHTVDWLEATRRTHSEND